MADWSKFKLPWFVELLGQNTAHEGFAKLCTDYALTKDSEEAQTCWYENKELGVSVYIGLGKINCIQFFSEQDLEFGGVLTPSFFGLNYNMNQSDIRGLLGLPDQTVEKRDTGAIKHAGIDRYDLPDFSVAFSYSLTSGKLKVISFEER